MSVARVSALVAGLASGVDKVLGDAGAVGAVSGVGVWPSGEMGSVGCGIVSGAAPTEISGGAVGAGIVSSRLPTSRYLAALGAFSGIVYFRLFYETIVA